MSEHHASQLSRRERQIMDIVYALGRSGVAEVRERLVDAPSYSAVRALLRILEEKGHLKHERVENRYVFSPTVPREQARRSALRHMLSTFFAGSAADAMTALLELEDSQLSVEEYERLRALIEETRSEGR